MSEYDFVIGAVDELPDPSSRGISLAETDPVTAFVVHKEGQVHVYKNSCPHTGAPLEWMPDRFLDMEENFIQCSIHGALFNIEDGVCLRGPCVGASLKPVPVKVVDGEIRVRKTSLLPETEA